MNGKIIVWLLATVLLITAPAEAQQAGKVSRIGLLSPRSSGLDPRVEAFRQGLREVGYIEGQNIIIEYRYADEKLNRLATLVAELVGLKVDVIVTWTTPGALAAKQATRTVPVVAVSGDPVETGLVASLARPGGNITGLAFIGSELEGKRLELLKEAASRISRVAILVNPANPAWDHYPRDFEDAARMLGMQLQRVEARDAGEFENAFSAITKTRADGLLVANDAIFWTHRKSVVELAAKNRLPAVSQVTGFAEAGGLIQYGPDTPEMFRRSATYVDKIIKGTKPADLPVERPTKFELVINLKTAKQIGVTIPPNVLARADKVIK